MPQVWEPSHSGCGTWQTVRVKIFRSRAASAAIWSAAALGTTLVLGACDQSAQSGALGGLQRDSAGGVVTVAFDSAAGFTAQDVSELGAGADISVRAQPLPTAELAHELDAQQADQGSPRAGQRLVLVLEQPDGGGDAGVAPADDAGQQSGATSGADADVPAGTVVGADYTCLAVNQAWFAVNQIPAPQSVAELRAGKWAPAAPAGGDKAAPGLGAQSGSDSQSGAGAAGPELPELSADHSDAQSGVALDSDPARWQSALWTYRHAAENPQDWRTLPDTCQEQQLTAHAAGKNGEALLAHLLTPAGQQELAASGVAYPVDPATELPAAVAEQAPRP